MGDHPGREAEEPDLTRLEAFKKRYREDPEFRAKILAQGAAYYAKNKRKVNARRRQKYRENPMPKREYRKRYVKDPAKREAIVNAYNRVWMKQWREDRRDANWLCENGCGRKTVDVTGLCQPCRTKPCRACGKPMIQLEIGQVVHRGCRPKGEQDPWA